MNGNRHVILNSKYCCKYTISVNSQKSAIKKFKKRRRRESLTENRIRQERCESARERLNLHCIYVITNNNGIPNRYCDALVDEDKTDLNAINYDTKIENYTISLLAGLNLQNIKCASRTTFPDTSGENQSLCPFLMRSSNQNLRYSRSADRKTRQLSRTSENTNCT